MSTSSGGKRSWKLGSNHTVDEWLKKMTSRGWTLDEITEAIEKGVNVPAVNKINPANSATRFIHPTTGRSVVVDDVTDEVIHVGGDGFLY